MKVIVEILEDGKYKDKIFENEYFLVKGERHAFSPSYAAQLIKENRAKYSEILDEDQEHFNDFSNS